MYKISTWFREKRLEIILSLLFLFVGYTWSLRLTHAFFLVGILFFLTSRNLSLFLVRIVTWAVSFKKELLFLTLVITIFFLLGNEFILLRLLLIVMASMALLFDLQHHSYLFKELLLPFISFVKTRQAFVLLIALIITLLKLWGFDYNTLVCTIAVYFCLFSKKKDTLLSLLSIGCLLVGLLFILLEWQVLADLMITNGFVFIAIIIMLRFITKINLTDLKLRGLNLK